MQPIALPCLSPHVEYEKIFPIDFTHNNPGLMDAERAFKVTIFSPGDEFFHKCVPLRFGNEYEQQGFSAVLETQRQRAVHFWLRTRVGTDSAYYNDLIAKKNYIQQKLDKTPQEETVLEKWFDDIHAESEKQKKTS